MSRLRLEPSRLPVRRPTAVRLSWAGGATPALRVAADGSVALPRPVRARGFRMTVVASRFPAGASQRERSTRAVGIAGVSVPGLAAAAPPAAGPLRAACGSVVVEVEGRRVPLRPRGTVAGLEAGRPLRGPWLPRPGRHGGGRPARALAAGCLQRGPAQAVLARAAPACRGRRGRPGAGPRPDREELGRGRAGGADGAVVARARPELLQGLEGQLRRSRPGRAAPDQRLRQRLARAG